MYHNSSIPQSIILTCHIWHSNMATIHVQSIPNKQYHSSSHTMSCHIILKYHSDAIHIPHYIINSTITYLNLQLIRLEHLTRTNSSIIQVTQHLLCTCHITVSRTFKSLPSQKLNSVSSKVIRSTRSVK